MNAAKFERQKFGALVATILENDHTVVEVQKCNDDTYILTIHSRREDRDRWDDLSAVIEPKHLEMLGSIAQQHKHGSSV